MDYPSHSRPPRLQNDPDKYVRRVKGGRFQARPYDEFERERHNLGLFPTRHAARQAILEFWWGQREAIPRFTKRIAYRDGRVAYLAEVVCGGKRERVGVFASREEAAAAVLGWHRGAYGLLFAEVALRRG